MSEQSDWSVLRMLEWATHYFSEKQVPSPRLSIEWLLADVLNIKRLELYLQFDRPLTSEELSRLRALVKRRAAHEPLQYITGSTSFYNAEINVRPGVLIPRPETEEMVEMILKESGANNLRVLDIGTGSGCIPIAIKMERPHWEVYGCDISPQALQIAKENAIRNDVDVAFVEGNLLDEKTMPKQTWDIIVSNPPYIGYEERDELERQVSEFEPEIALFTDNRTGIYSSIISYAQSHLNKSGSLYLELHYQHMIEDENLLNPNIWDFEIRLDSANKRRVVKAVLV